MAFLQPVSVGDNLPELQYVFREAPEQEPIFYVSFGVRDNLVTETSVVIYNPSAWLPAETLELSYLLSAMLSVPEVYLSINITVGRVFLTLAYDEGVFARYGMCQGH